MRQLFATLTCLLLLATAGRAQLVTTITSTDTLSNADATYISFGTLADGAKSVQAVLTRLSGALAGKVYLEANNDKANWVTIDSSAALTDGATATHLFTCAGNGLYLQYRLKFVTTGTVSAVPRGVLLRRHL